MENIIFDQNTMNDDDTLDTSWIDLQNKIDDIHEHYFREPMQEINLFCIYVNDDSNIEHVISEKEMLAPLSNGKMGITKDRLLHLIQTKKSNYRERDKKCKLVDILYYNAVIESVDLERDYMDENWESPYSSFFKTLPIFDEIIVDDSIFVFHDVNSIFFIFKQFATHNSSLKSILKPSDNSSAKSTKKVHIDTTRNKEFSTKLFNKSMKLKNRRKMTRRK